MLPHGDLTVVKIFGWTTETSTRFLPSRDGGDQYEFKKYILSCTCSAQKGEYDLLLGYDFSVVSDAETLLPVFAPSVFHFRFHFYPFWDQ